MGVFTKGCSMTRLQGCIRSCDQSFFPQLAKTIENPKFQGALLKFGEAATEVYANLTKMPLFGASPRRQHSAEKAREYMQITRGMLGLFVNGIPAAQRGYEAFKRSVALWNHNPSEVNLLEGQCYPTVAEKNWEVTGLFFKIASEGLFATAFLVCHPLKMPEYIDKIRDKRNFPEPFTMPEPFHTIGAWFDTVMMVRSLAKTGEAVCHIVRDGLHYYSGSDYYEKKSKKVTVDGKDYFSPREHEHVKIEDPVEKFLLLLESLTKHILTLLDSIPSFGIYLIKVANITAPPVVKIVLNVISSTAGLVKVIIEVW